MRTIPTPSTKGASKVALTLLLLLAASQGVAQNDSTRPTSRAAKLEWPRTFTGQPDFLFTRDEAISDARTRAAREKEPMPLSPSLQQLLEDDSALDPLGINKPEEIIVTDASGIVVSDTTDTPRGQTLMERLMAQAVDLPAVATTGKTDLTEFSAQLSATISNTIAGWQPQPGRFNFDAVLRGLVVQAIVTSPVKYAVINQQRYNEGETFRISVPLPVPDADITAAMDKLMPAPGALPPALEANYTATYKAIWDGFAYKRNQTPGLGRQTLVLPIRITGITARQVLLDVNGQPYALQIRYAY